MATDGVRTSTGRTLRVSIPRSEQHRKGAKHWRFNSALASMVDQGYTEAEAAAILEAIERDAAAAERERIRTRLIDGPEYWPMELGRLLAILAEPTS